ncbi:Retroelement pol Polyprotein [Phytophthora megakarya]|uniref:Retroelement pol Polyprotein n=1 Tax=Phytophthora megakarya TaxID=4795 RepID=A0A225UW80_9STRA|nr:Retroelement pol Polyprotein [Phytophthora megakarya]
MNDLKERNCKDLPDYISKFRHLITKVKEMSELDKIMYFLRGLPSRIREENQYRRSATLTDAITVPLDYDRSHSHRGSDGAHDRPRYRSYDHKRSKRNDDGPVPMEIDNVRVPSKEECMRRNLCFRCGSSAHRARNCPEQPEQKQMAKHDVVQQGSRPTSSVTTSVKVNAVKSDRKSNLFIKKGRVIGKDVRIWLDTGASTNMIKPGLASTVLLSRRLQAQRFDGTLTPPTDVKHVEAPVSMDGYFFPTMEFVEWKLSESHDVIFGEPGFEEFNPQVIWQTEEVTIPERMQFMDVDGPTFTQQLNAGEYEQVYRVKLQIEPDLDGIPGPIRKVVTEEFKDVFPEQLPDGLPPMREVNFELTLKKGAQPSTRAPFRMSKMEQDAFEEFVKDKLQKGWIEVSNSPWISNINSKEGLRYRQDA